MRVARSVPAHDPPGSAGRAWKSASDRYRLQAAMPPAPPVPGLRKRRGNGACPRRPGSQAAATRRARMPARTCPPPRFAPVPGTRRRARDVACPVPGRRWRGRGARAWWAVRRCRTFRRPRATSRCRRGCPPGCRRRGCRGPRRRSGWGAGRVVARVAAQGPWRSAWRTRRRRARRRRHRHRRPLSRRPVRDRRGSAASIARRRCAPTCARRRAGWKPAPRSVRCRAPAAPRQPGYRRHRPARRTRRQRRVAPACPRSSRRARARARRRGGTCGRRNGRCRRWCAQWEVARGNSLKCSSSTNFSAATLPTL